MQIIHDIGIVLKKTVYQDSKLIATVFTKDQGLIQLNVTFSKKQLYKLACFEMGQIIDVELAPYKTSFRLVHVSVHFAAKHTRETLETLTLLSRFCLNLSKLLPENAANPTLFTFLKHALIAFDTHEDKKSLISFIWFKWLQHEGLLDLSSVEAHLLQELDNLLQLRQFKELSPLSEQARLFIDENLSRNS